MNGSAARRSGKLLLTIHLACVTTSLGVPAACLVLLTGQPAGEPAAQLVGSSRLFTGCLVAQALAFGSGVVVAGWSRWGLFRYGWVVKKLGLTTAGLLVQAGLCLLRYRGIRLWQWEAGLAVVLLLSLLATVLSVYKPGVRADRSRRDRPVAIREVVR